MIRVAVVEEHDIFRRGIVGCLGDDPAVAVVHADAAGPLPGEADVAVVSHAVATREAFPCPVIVCGAEDPPAPRTYSANAVLAILPRASLTSDQLSATVHAAAAGLRVLPREGPAAPHAALDPRSIEVLRMLARGADTEQISHALSYSQRTVKAVIADIQRRLGARNRTHAVAEGIRSGII